MTLTPTKTKKRSARRRVHRSTPTVAPTATSTPTPTPTSTPTSTPTATPTPTAAPTPSVQSLIIAASAPSGYAVGFSLCGIPNDLGIGISPNPAVSNLRNVFDGSPSATATVNVTVPPNYPAGQYSFALRAYYHQPGGGAVVYPPSGGATDPRALLLTVTSTGQVTLSGTSSPPAVGYQDCSAPPSGYGPASNNSQPVGPVLPYAYVRNPVPVQNGLETLSAALQQGTQTLTGVRMHANWFFPYGIESCDGISDRSGFASCSLSVGPTPHGYTVQVQVFLYYQGAQYITYTSFVVA